MSDEKRHGEMMRGETTSDEVGLTYKVVELSHVTDGEMEAAINTWVGAGWQFDGVHFAMRDASKRPAMAFLMFTRKG